MCDWFGPEPLDLQTDHDRSTRRCQAGLRSCLPPGAFRLVITASMLGSMTSAMIALGLIEPEPARAVTFQPAATTGLVVEAARSTTGLATGPVSRGVPTASRLIPAGHDISSEEWKVERRQRRFEIEAQSDRISQAAERAEWRRSLLAFAGLTRHAEMARDFDRESGATRSAPLNDLRWRRIRDDGRRIRSAQLQSRRTGMERCDAIGERATTAGVSASTDP